MKLRARCLQQPHHPTAKLSDDYDVLVGGDGRHSAWLRLAMANRHGLISGAEADPDLREQIRTASWDQGQVTEASLLVILCADLKAWDKDNKDVKLGGIAILTWEDGKMKTRKVGTRDTKKGAGWGTALGVTAAILSGGVTLVGGALVGAAAGGATGALFHKGIGLSDDDKSQLEDKLKDGGAALVVMASDARSARERPDRCTRSSRCSPVSRLARVGQHRPQL